MITSVFLQKSLEAYRDPGIQRNIKFLKRVLYNDQFCKNRSLKFDNINNILRIIHSCHFMKINNIQVAYFHCF